MDEYFYKKFVIGLVLDENISDYHVFLTKYGKYIYSIYFSLPLGEQYHSRLLTKTQFANEKNINLLETITPILKKYNIKSEIVLNTNSLSTSDLKKAINYISNIGLPDEIVCNDLYIDYLYNELPDTRYIRSFNSPKIKSGKLISKYFSELVVGEIYLRDVDKRHVLLNNGFKLQLLLNNGCSFHCSGCYYTKTKCEDIYNNDIEKYGENYIYALQSFFPQELTKLIQNDDQSHQYHFKISNRTTNLKITSLIMDSYLGKYSVKDLLYEDKRYYYFWGMLKWFDKHFDDYNIDTINSIKRTLYFEK